MDIVVNKQLDMLGLRCPEPIMLVRKTIRELDLGIVLYVISDDPSTTRDIPSFCRHMNHKLLASQTENKPYQYWIEKAN